MIRMKNKHRVYNPVDPFSANIGSEISSTEMRVYTTPMPSELDHNHITSRVDKEEQKD